MDDRESMQLLRLLHKYVKAYTPDIPQTVSQLAEDIGAVNDGEYTNEADRLVDEIRNTEGVT